ncbi:hypothetical protein ACFQ21_25000 [Ohtaekwangia kribbensis]|uniref:Uncharacterized protein n=1 Tax=Ohtaekwangia kribbensis TaxID=688913 RepID=A0ABW3K9F6_9BACT
MCDGSVESIVSSYFYIFHHSTHFA